MRGACALGSGIARTPSYSFSASASFIESARPSSTIWFRARWYNPKSVESENQAAICDYLALRGWLVIRLNNIPGLYVDGDGGQRFPPTGRCTARGWPICSRSNVTGRLISW